MFPWVFGFKWQIGNLIFLGVFFSVVTVVAATLVVAMKRVLESLKTKEVEKISWHEHFEDLPAEAKLCRHTIAGEFQYRLCPNGFDCRICDLHPKIAVQRALTDEGDREVAGISFFGLDMPQDRMYHRGHTWVKRGKDSTFTIGLDSFAKKLIGTPDLVVLPEIGSELTVNGICCSIEKNGVKFRVLSPVDGRVVNAAIEEGDPVIRVAPASGVDLRHLLKGPEVRFWLLKEMERLQSLFSTEKVGVSLADGGELANDISRTFPGADWQRIFPGIFLDD